MPATYPMSLPELPTSVFVANPAQESKYAIYFAIAGHEIGHSVWRHHQVGSRLLPILMNNVKAQLHSVTTSSPSIDTARLMDVCLTGSLRQLEEVFCDLFALRVFGESYPYAFDYYLGPGSPFSRVLEYPSTFQRNKYMIDAANAMNIKISHDVFLNWTDSAKPAPENAHFFHVTDNAVDSLINELTNIVVSLVESCSIPFPDKDRVEDILESFRINTPYHKQASLAELLCAGWRHLHLNNGFGHSDGPKRFEMLNEILLKSVEVSEFIGLTS